MGSSNPIKDVIGGITGSSQADAMEKQRKMQEEANRKAEMERQRQLELQREGAIAENMQKEEMKKNIAAQDELTKGQVGKGNTVGSVVPPAASDVNGTNWLDEFDPENI